MKRGTQLGELVHSSRQIVASTFKFLEIRENFCLDAKNLMY